MIAKQNTPFIKDAIYLSYTSLSDFLKCPRAYYFKNIYRNSQGNRIQIASPYLSLGALIHDTIKWYLQMNKQATEEQVILKFKNLWLKYRGKKGGFISAEEEANFGKRGIEMLKNFLKNIHRLEKNAPPVSFPKYHLIDNVILTGNFDYIGQRKDGTLHLIDFKTGSSDEKDSTQLHIYAILAESNLGKAVSKASYWYLDRDDSPKEIVLDDLEPKIEWLKEKALLVKQAIEENNWVCVREDGCMDCKDYQAVIDGKGEFIFSDEFFKKDIYFLDKSIKDMQIVQ